MYRKIVIWSILAIALLVSTGCFSGNPSGLTNLPAEDFSLETVEGGQTITLSKLNDKPTLLIFWASWCPACKSQIKNMNNRYSGIKDKVHVIGVSTDAERRDALAGYKSLGITWTSVWDEGGKVAMAYKVSAIPVSVLIDSSTKVVKVWEGAGIEDEIIASVNALTSK